MIGVLNFMVELYSDGCYSQVYKIGGTGSVLLMDGRVLKWGHQVVGLESKGPEIEFIAQLEGILWLYRKLEGKVSQVSLVLYSDNHEVIHKLVNMHPDMKRRTPPQLPVSLRAKYNYVMDILQEFKSWEIREAHAKDSRRMRQADSISRKTREALKDYL